MERSEIDLLACLTLPVRLLVFSYLPSSLRRKVGEVKDKETWNPTGPTSRTFWRGLLISQHKTIDQVRYLLINEGFLFSEEDWYANFDNLETIVTHHSYITSPTYTNFFIRPDEKLHPKIVSISHRDNREILFLPPALGTFDSMKYLVTISIVGCGLTNLPETIGQLTNLNRICCGGNRIETLPESIGCLSSLGILIIDNNCLKRLPMTIGRLGNLEYLSLSNNPITKLPSTMGDLTRLSSLYIDGTGIDKGYYSHPWADPLRLSIIF